MITKKERSSRSFVNIEKRERSDLVVVEVEAGGLEMEAMDDIALVWFSKALEPCNMRG